MIIQKLKIKIITLGKVKEKYLKEGTDEFLKRLMPYCSVSVIEIPPTPIRDENLTGKVLLEEGEKQAIKKKVIAYSYE